MTIERHPAGMLARETIPATGSQARSSTCADHQASRLRTTAFQVFDGVFVMVATVTSGTGVPSDTGIESRKLLSR